MASNEQTTANIDSAIGATTTDQAAATSLASNGQAAAVSVASNEQTTAKIVLAVGATIIDQAATVSAASTEETTTNQVAAEDGRNDGVAEDEEETPRTEKRATAVIAQNKLCNGKKRSKYELSFLFLKR